MKDIKSLFMTAKDSGRDVDICSYSNAIQEAMQTPMDYISNLEYIIQSNIGVSTFKEFVESNGLPIVLYEQCMGLIDECIRRCNIFKKPVDEYTEAKSFLESYKAKYIKEFAMFDYFCDELPKNYISSYYSVNESGIHGRQLAAGMIKVYKETAIPDMIIAAKELNHGDAAGRLTHEIETFCTENVELTPMLCEWVKFVDANCVEEFKENSASSVVENVRRRNNAVYRESVITGDTSATYEYTEDELECIARLIEFKENLITWSNELGLDPFKEQKEIYSLYEELDGILFEEDDNIFQTSADDEEPLVPVFGVVKSYSPDKFRNDGTPKSKGDMTSTNLKKLMHVITRGDNYSHAVISFDPEMKDMYSFESPGFVHDSFDQDIWITTDNIYICVMFIKKSEKERILQYMKSMDGNSSSKFAFLNMLRGTVGKPEKIDKRFICSAFVAYCLGYSNRKNLTRDYSRCRPEDITILPRAFYVMNVKDRNEFYRRQDEFKQRVNEIFAKHKDEIEDYNNFLPKITLKDRMDRLKTIDKIIDWIVAKAPRTNDGGSEPVSESTESKEDH